MNIKQNVTELVGNTPLIEFNKLEKDYDLKAHIIGKLEYMNPAGSIKDRIALSIIEDYEEKGILKEGFTIIEPTSGNTGIGLSMIASIKGYKVIITMPSTMSKERIALMKAYGAEVVLTDGTKGMKGAIEKANELHEKIENSIIAGQFENMANPLAHYKTTGPEIYKDSDGKVDIFVAGIGTGGTISGVGKYLKEQNKDIKVVGVEPASSPVLTEGKSGGHKIQGIGAGFIPHTLNTDIYDEVITVTNEDAFAATKLIARKEGVLVGISSGAAIVAALKLAKREENAGKNIVVILPDTGNRYLSLDLFN